MRAPLAERFPVGLTGGARLGYHQVHQVALAQLGRARTADPVSPVCTTTSRALPSSRSEFGATAAGSPGRARCSAAAPGCPSAASTARPGAAAARPPDTPRSRTVAAGTAGAARRSVPPRRTPLRAPARRSGRPRQGVVGAGDRHVPVQEVPPEPAAAEHPVHHRRVPIGAPVQLGQQVGQHVPAAARVVEQRGVRRDQPLVAHLCGVRAAPDGDRPAFQPVDQCRMAGRHVTTGERATLRPASAQRRRNSPRACSVPTERSRTVFTVVLAYPAGSTIELSAVAGSARRTVPRTTGRGTSRTTTGVADPLVAQRPAQQVEVPRDVHRAHVREQVPGVLGAARHVRPAGPLPVGVARRP